MSNYLFLLTEEEYRKIITSFESKGTKIKDIKWILDKMKCQAEYNEHLDMASIKHEVKELFG